MGKNYLAGCKDENIVALVRPGPRIRRAGIQDLSAAPGLQGFPGDVRQGAEELRRPDCRHAGPLALSPGAGRPGDGQAHLLRQADHPHHRRGPQGQGGVSGLQAHHQGQHPGFPHQLRPRHHRIAASAAPSARFTKCISGPAPTAPAAWRGPEAQTPPAGMDWDQWCGPSPYRPYHKTYHYGNWRPWWDFGTGTVGDFGCHTLQMFHDELEMGAARLGGGDGCQAFSLAGRVENPECMSIANTVQWHIPARGNRPAMMAFFYDGGLHAAAAGEHAAGGAHAGQRHHVRGRKGRADLGVLRRQPVAAVRRQPRPGQQVRGLPGGWLLPESQIQGFPAACRDFAALRKAGPLHRVGAHVQSRQEVDHAHRIRLRADGVRPAWERWPCAATRCPLRRLVARPGTVAEPAPRVDAGRRKSSSGTHEP